MRSWLPADHVVWFLIDVVQMLDVSRFAARESAKTSMAGRAGYDPRVMLTLLLYGYACGVYSSRRIEVCCRQDVSFRVVCADDVPDHATIARFRRDYFADPDAVEWLFTEVLRVAAEAGLGKLGKVAFDGTKIAANASKDTNRGEDWLREQVRAMLAEAEACDTAEDEVFGSARGDGLPEDLADPVRRTDRIRRAHAQVAAERATAERARTVKAEEYLTARADRRPPRGPVPEDIEVQVAEIRLAEARQGLRRREGLRPGRAAEQLERAKARAKQRAESPSGRARQRARELIGNITDPDSRLMPVRGGGFIQGYNGQAAIAEDHLCLAADLLDDTGDVGAFTPMLRAAEHAATIIAGPRAKTAAAAGACCTCRSRDRCRRCDMVQAFQHPGPRPDGQTIPNPDTAGEHTPGCAHRCPIHSAGLIELTLWDAGYLSQDNATTPGPDRLIAVGKRRDLEHAARTAATSDQARPAAAIEAMAHRLATPDGIAAYRHRGHIAEGRFGDTKHNRGFRRFTTRGQPRARSEWKFTWTVHNLLTIHRAQPAT